MYTIFVHSVVIFYDCFYIPIRSNERKLYGLQNFLYQKSHDGFSPQCLVAKIQPAVSCCQDLNRFHKDWQGAIIDQSSKSFAKQEFHGVTVF